MSMELGYKIRRMREIMGVKQEVVYDGLGIKQSTYSEIESGIADVSDERLDRIAEILGTTSETIKAYDDKVIVNIINHHNGNGTAASSNHFNIQAIDDLQKLVELIAAPYKEQVAALKELATSQKEEIQFLRSHFKQER
jgi:transcriptional regulator with XRE-family HTH domain